ncbi:MAG TPA: condensation domain-containing protein, partial [Longimicrobium sp.]|nr:condensation domain-containing protein [Longimicrobium sp.]
PGLATYNVPVSLRLEGPLDEAAFARAVDEVVRRHQVLRTVIQVGGDGEPVQVVQPFRPGTLSLEEVPGDTLPAREAELERLLGLETAAPFELGTGPLYRARLLRLTDGDHAFLFTAHHTVSDGWSSGVLLRELAALYAAFARGEASPLPELPIQYADFAAWQRRDVGGQALDAQAAWWRERLAGAPALLELPTDRPRPAEQSFRGARCRTRYGRELQERVRALAQAEGVSLYMVLLSAFNVLLAKYSGQTDLLVGSPSAGRRQKETEPLIGFFANTLVLRNDLSGDPTFRELLARVRAATLDAFAHQDVPFEKLVEELRPERTRSHSPLFQVLFALQNVLGDIQNFPGVAARPVRGASISANFDLAVAMAEGAEGLVAWVDYAQDLWDETTAWRMLEHLGALLESATAHPERRLSELSMLSAQEQAAVLRTAAGPAADHPLVPVHRLVGVCMERTPEMIVSLLAVLKAGGAYVPVDPAYPAERIGYMLEDTQAPVLLTQSSLADRLPAATAATIVNVDLDAPTIGQHEASDPRFDVSPANL